MRHTTSNPARLLLGTALFLMAGGAVAAGTTLQTTTSDEYGHYVVDAAGNSLYLFEADESGKSACRKACAEIWPPVTTDGKPQAGEGVDASRLGTLERADGRMQVTYGGHPLYRFANDKNPGDTAGQDVKGFGAEWYLVNAEGNKVGHEEEAEEDEMDDDGD